MIIAYKPINQWVIIKMTKRKELTKLEKSDITNNDIFEISKGVNNNESEFLENNSDLTDFNENMEIDQDE